MTIADEIVSLLGATDGGPMTGSELIERLSHLNEQSVRTTIGSLRKAGTIRLDVADKKWRLADDDEPADEPPARKKRKPKAARATEIAQPKRTKRGAKKTRTARVKEAAPATAEPIALKRIWAGGTLVSGPPVQPAPQGDDLVHVSVRCADLRVELELPMARARSILDAVLGAA